MKYADRALLIHSEKLQNWLSSVLDSDEVSTTGCNLIPVSVNEFLREPFQSQVFSNFDVPRKLFASMELALQIPEYRYDVLRCNGKLVLCCLNLGEFPFYNNTGITCHGDPVTKA